jgi:catechol 2,3-dioxygenase-like lactoylglutathione lyase family enzyme
MSTPAPLRGIHHVKVPVADLDVSLAFYERTLCATRLPEADHVRDDGTRYACILRVPGLDTLLELRLNPEQAAAQWHFDPLTIAVDDRDALAAWDAHLTSVGAPHSPVLPSLQAWLVVVEDPDGIRVRLYTLETHGPEVVAAGDDPWITG